MAYTDRRRATFANLAEQVDTRRRQASFERRAPTPVTVWLRLDPATGQPEVTRRTTNLRQYRLRGSRVSSDVSPAWNVEQFPDVAARIGLRVWTVEDVETGQRYDLPPMGNGTTVWTVHP
jgi:hypothetical protein